MILVTGQVSEMSDLLGGFTHTHTTLSRVYKGRKSEKESYNTLLLRQSSEEKDQTGLS